eukprot:scaffold4323_cov133-Skeletonema_marinoi.AAC.8
MPLTLTEVISSNLTSYSMVYGCSATPKKYKGSLELYVPPLARLGTTGNPAWQSPQPSFLPPSNRSVAFSLARACDGGEVKDKIATLLALEGNQHLHRILQQLEVSAECKADADLLDLKFAPKRDELTLHAQKLKVGSTIFFYFSEARAKRYVAPELFLCPLAMGV